MTPASTPLISIIVPTFNCSDSLSSVLRSILTFTDDDIDADRFWLEAIARAFEDARVVVGGRSLPRYAATPPDWVERQWADTPYGRHLGYLSLVDFGDRRQEIDPTFVFGLNYSIRKRGLLELKGFNPDCVPDHLLAFLGDGETGLSMKAKGAGFKALYDPKVLVYHRISAHRLTSAYFEKRASGQGVSDSYTFLPQRSGPVHPIDRARLTKLWMAQTAPCSAASSSSVEQLCAVASASPIETAFDSICPKPCDPGRSWNGLPDRAIFRTTGCRGSLAYPAKG
jgi:hypothetical protein